MNGVNGMLGTWSEHTGRAAREIYLNQRGALNRSLGWNSLLMELFWPQLCSNGSERGWIRLLPAVLNWNFGAATDVFNFQCGMVEMGWSFFLTACWTQACQEGKGTNGTHRSYARCHPDPIPQPVEVGHTTGVYVPYSFRTVAWVLLESLTICRCHYKGSTFFSVI